MTRVRARARSWCSRRNWCTVHGVVATKEKGGRAKERMTERLTTARRGARAEAQTSRRQPVRALVDEPCRCRSRQHCRATHIQPCARASARVYTGCSIGSSEKNTGDHQYADEASNSIIRADCSAMKKRKKKRRESEAIQLS